MSQKPVRRGSRRAQLPAVPGTDPTPQAVPEGADVPVRAGEDTDRAWGDSSDANDERLKRDVPPHW
ncbi:MAG TPA: hypothetical protein VGI08_08000 [Diaminobutyricibacter sp.]|uniref:hypothetical protein n=1 Tax=Leifsonia sp. McL0618 TaxID=3415677 RepID=UPI003389C372